MAAKDIKKHQFTSEHQPKARRSRRGVPNRATVYRNLLKLKVDVLNPERRGTTLRLSMYEAVALGQIKSAMHGNTRAWIEIQDSLFGKQLSGVVDLNVTAEQLKQLSDEELDAILKQLDRGYVKGRSMISIIEARQNFEARRENVRQEIEALDDD